MEMLRSCSSAYCFSKLPALARVVAREEKRMLGGGVMVERKVGQVLVSVEMCGERVTVVLELEGGVTSRRVMVWMLEKAEGEERRVMRICEP
jgi:hypothetical protein